MTPEDMKDEKSFKITHEAKNGKEALALLKEHKFDMVITDIDMPEMNGFETCQKIREIDKSHIPIIFLSANEIFSIINWNPSNW